MAGPITLERRDAVQHPFRHCGLKPERGVQSWVEGTRLKAHVSLFIGFTLVYRAGLDPNPLLPWLSAYLDTSTCSEHSDIFEQRRRPWKRPPSA